MQRAVPETVDESRDGCHFSERTEIWGPECQETIFISFIPLDLIDLRIEAGASVIGGGVSGNEVEQPISVQIIWISYYLLIKISVRGSLPYGDRVSLLNTNVAELSFQVYRFSVGNERLSVAI